MLKEALEYLAKLQTPPNPVTVKVGEVNYAVKADGTIGAVVAPVDTRLPRPTLRVSTLSGLVAAYKAKLDKLGARVAIVIRDPFIVALVDLDADEFGKVNEYATAIHAEEKPFKFDTWLEPEEFLLSFRARFLWNDNAVTIQQICSTIGAATGVAVSDDGISQEVTVKSGTITKSAVQLPADGIELIPVRTFRDANPVAAKFLLRMKGVKDSLPKIALYEIDPMWKLYLAGSIRKYLETELPEAIIIS
jgi:hypothetical protein